MSIAENDLMDFLLDTDEANEQAQSEHFTVDSIDKAGWCMRKLAQLAKQDAEDETAAQREIERIQAWLEARKSPRQQHREFFEAHLQRFHADQLLKDDKMKTIKLPHGQLKARKVPDKVEYDDRAVIDWAKENGLEDEFVRVKEEPIKTAVKDYMKETGRQVPGVTVIPQGIKFSVEVDV